MLRNSPFVAICGCLLLSSCIIEPNPSPYEGPILPGDRTTNVTGQGGTMDTFGGEHDAGRVPPPPRLDAGYFADSVAAEDAAGRPSDDAAGPDDLLGPFPIDDGHVVRYVFIASAAAGGRLAVRITWPEDPEQRRFGLLPAVIEVPGGTKPPRLSQPFELAAPSWPGILHVEITLPGTGNAPYDSGGAHDYRGPASAEAIRDIVRFLRDKLPDDLGQLASELLPPIDAGAIGLIGLSNGGNLATVAASGAPADLCYLALWESPIADQFATVDIGGRGEDPDQDVDADDNGVPWDDMIHASYVPGSCTVAAGCPLAYDHLAWVAGVLFGDYDGDGMLGDGAGALDLNGNGRRDPDEDISYAAFPGEAGQMVYSLPLTVAAAEQGVFGADWPADVATVEESDVYWAARSALSNLAGLAGSDLHAIVLATPRDHVQAAPDNPHVWLAYDGLRAQLGWVRLNPDAAYLSGGGPSGNSPPESPANTPISAEELPATLSAWSGPWGKSTPLRRAAIYELVDRCVTGTWDPDLDAPIAAVPSLP